MLFIIGDEIVPETHSNGHERVTTLGLMLGRRRDALPRRDARIAVVDSGALDSVRGPGSNPEPLRARPGSHRIVDEVFAGLYVGTLADAEDTTTLRDHGVDRVVSLTRSNPEVESTVAVSKHALLDGPRSDGEVFRAAVEESVTGLNRGETVLVHCSRGASRSPSVAAAAIALHGGVGVEAAFEHVTERRAEVDPHPALVRQAVAVYRAHQS
jgi:predicted protein tyrosine phosphatase